MRNVKYTSQVSGLLVCLLRWPGRVSSAARHERLTSVRTLVNVMAELRRHALLVVIYGTGRPLAKHFSLVTGK